MKEPEKPRAVPWQTRFLARFIVGIVRLLCLTVRLTVDREQETDALMAGGGMLVTWHGRTMLPINRFRNRTGYYMLVSLSRDGDLQSEVMRASGYGVIRGSTGRRGVAATREVLAMLAKGGIFAFTPDGPRGPSGKVQPGVVYFAQRSGKPIIPAGISAYPRWQVNTWDRYLVPKPFSRARWIYGDPIYVAPTDDLDAACVRVEEAINRLEAEAERAVCPVVRR